MFNRLFVSPKWAIIGMVLISNLYPLSSYAHDLTRYEIKILLRHKIDAIISIAANPLIVDQVKAHNLKNITLPDIRRLDRQWQQSAHDDPLKRSMHQSPAGQFLKRLIIENSDVYNEAFLTGKNGANIAAYPVTSDYWQGDEEKWIRAFNQGNGDIYIGHVEYDESSKTSALQISVPVIDNRKAIGVLITGIKLTHLQARYLAPSSDTENIH